MLEELTWVGIGFAVLQWFYNRERRVPGQPVLYKDAQNELDIRRWAHNGAQPTWSQRGNRRPVYNAEVLDLQKRIA